MVLRLPSPPGRGAGGEGQNYGSQHGLGLDHRIFGDLFQMRSRALWRLSRALQGRDFHVNSNLSGCWKSLVPFIRIQGLPKTRNGNIRNPTDVLTSRI